VRGKIARGLAALACTALLFWAQPDGLGAQDAPNLIGVFESHQDIGTVLHPGSAEYDRSRHTYTISGSGNNMWSTEDDFQFVWKKMSGDVAVSADISILGQGGNPHKKAVLMMRQSLDALLGFLCINSPLMPSN